MVVDCVLVSHAPGDLRPELILKVPYCSTARLASGLFFVSLAALSFLTIPFRLCVCAVWL